MTARESELPRSRVHQTRHVDALPSGRCCRSMRMLIWSVRDDLGSGLQDVPGGEREEVVRPTQDLRCLEKLVRVEWRTVKTD